PSYVTVFEERSTRAFPARTAHSLVLGRAVGFPPSTTSPSVAAVDCLRLLPPDSQSRSAYSALCAPPTVHLSPLHPAPLAWLSTSLYSLFPLFLVWLSFSLLLCPKPEMHPLTAARQCS